MAYDTNPFASSPGADQSASLGKSTMTGPNTLPSYLQQQPNPTLPGAANNMIRALMSGAQQQPQDAPGMAPGGSSVASLMGASPADQSVSAGLTGASVPYGAPPTDPANASIAALMTPPPTSPYTGF